MKYKKNITEIKNLDLELYFATEILKLNSLHYGYWDSSEALTLDNLRKAQIRYSTTLMSLIPKEVRTVLDVGAGIGDNAKALAEKGYIVTSVSPDKMHKKYFDRMKNKNITFYNCKFEDFDTDTKFDLILMSESHTYFDTEIGFNQCVKYLNKNGYLLVSGKFRLKDSSQFKTVITIENDYINKAQKYGFKLLKNIDITDFTLPSLTMAFKAYKEYLSPTVDLIKYYFTTSAKFKLKLLQFFFKKQFKEISRLYEYYGEQLNPDKFSKYVRYKRMLFQKQK